MTVTAFNHRSKLSPLLTSAPVLAPVAFMLRVLGVLLILAASCNALLYSDAVATPLVQADAWYFLESFLSRYFDGTLTFLDLFVQRGVGDHAQPLQKLILLFHTRYFDMDFRIEGLIGTSIGILWCCVIALEMRKHTLLNPLQNAFSWICIGLVFALGLSLNSSNIFTWPLVTLGYIPLLLGTLYFAVLMTQLEKHRPAVVCVATLLLGLCIDEIAVVVVIAAALACVPLLVSSNRRKGIILLAAVSGLVLARIFLWWVAYRAGSTSAMLPAQGSLVDTLFNKEALNGMLIPFSDSLVHLELLSSRYPNSTGNASLFTAAFVIALHLYFWFTTLRSWRSGVYNRTLAMATFLMLVAYALTAGIIVSRVPAFDWNYLHQPRYVMTYQMGSVAIAMMFHHRLAHPATERVVGPWIERLMILGLIWALLSVQWSATRYSWQLPYYLIPYWQNTALAMQRLAADPVSPPGPCPDIMTVCEYSKERRAHLTSLLVDKQLNIFSSRFQIRNRLYPSLNRLPGFGPGMAQAQSFDRRIVQATVSAALSATPLAANCAKADEAQPMRIEVETHDLAPLGTQLWIESIGASRSLLASTTPQETSFTLEQPLRNHTSMSLVRADTQALLAQYQVALPDCGAPKELQSLR